MTRVLHLSDPHFGAADEAIAGAFLDRARALSPDLTILSGDLTMRARRTELVAAKRFVDLLPQPLLLIAGNHDIPAINQPFERFFDPFGRYRRVFSSDLEPEITTAGCHVVSFNSARAFGFHADWSEGRVSSRQLARTRRRFTAGPAGLHRILVLHHPLLAPAGQGREVIKPLRPLLETLGQARVDLVLCGHFHLSHLATAGTADGWKSMVSQAPTVCSIRLQGEAQGFHEILLEKSRAEIIRHDWDGKSFRIKSKVRFGLGEQGWQATGPTPAEEITG